MNKTVTDPVRYAADGILAPLCEKVGRFMLEEPDRDAIATMADYEVVIPFSAFQALYDATDDRATLQSQEQIKLLREALAELWRVIDIAGLHNLSNGVQLGQTSWFVKASDAVEQARQALEATNG